MRDLVVIAPCIHDNPLPVERLGHNLWWLGIPFRYYGIKKKFNNFRYAKMHLLKEELRQQERSFRYVLVTDGFDTLYYMLHDDILERFFSIGKGKMVISAEQSCYPLTELTDDFPQSPTPFRFPNAGQYMGKMSDVISYLDESERDFSSYFKTDDNRQYDDQSYLTLAVARKTTDAVLDYHCKLFTPLSGVDWKDIVFNDSKPPVPFNTLTGYTTASLHFNGGKDDITLQKIEELFNNLKSYYA
jgi:hypothetical protein